MGTALISNPPYNMKWTHPPFAQIQSRFADSIVPPESNANYAFVLTALNYIDTKAVLLLPGGVLTTESKEEKQIRKWLIEKNYVEAVIICPDKMFEVTTISTCIVVLNKQKHTSHISFVDMRQTYVEEQREQNGQYGGASKEKRTYKKSVKVFSEAQMKKAVECIEKQLSIAEFSKSVSVSAVCENNYNLSPSQYIDFESHESEHRSYSDIVADINRIINEKNACKLTINESLAKSLGFDDSLYNKEQNDDELNKLLEKISGKKLVKHNYFATSKNKSELKFENKSKGCVSSVLIMILNSWKQHIYYLNREENRYLAELRDTLLPELMSGKIDV